MNNSLRYISISHKTASVAEREDYHLSDDAKDDLTHLICKTFSGIKGLLLLSTCNRTEIYFESGALSAKTLLHFFINYKNRENTTAITQLFRYSNNTEDTITHLLQVSSGLKSLVLGDAEIIHQIKKAYQFSMAHNLQGSLLERSLQVVFKSHKRISNESQFRDGTTSVAYKSLKVIRDSFDKSSFKTKKILLIGAGDIVLQLFKYNSKFNFSNIYISNRTAEKAKILSKTYQCKIYDWNKVLKNDFENFDAIISAVSNSYHLIKTVPQSNKKHILIDLAIPTNFDKASISENNVNFYDLDRISMDLEKTKKKRYAAINKVDTILSEELAHFKKWLKDATLRDYLIKSKLSITQKVIAFLKDHNEEFDTQKVQYTTNKVMRKLMAQSNTTVTIQKIDSIIAHQAY